MRAAFTEVQDAYWSMAEKWSGLAPLTCNNRGTRRVSEAAKGVATTVTPSGEFVQADAFLGSVPGMAFKSAELSATILICRQKWKCATLRIPHGLK